MKKKFQAKTRSSQEMSLNITAMADIFTVLLVFLLMGFSAGGVNIAPSAGIKLPVAFTAPTSLEALKLEISEKSVNVEGKPVAGLAGFRFNAADLNQDGTARALVETLKIERARQMALAKANSDVKLDARVIVIADEKVPYATVKAVLASAAVQGYTDFKLAVAQGQ